jgi:hypothetical protein
LIEGVLQTIYKAIILILTHEQLLALPDQVHRAGLPLQHAPSSHQLSLGLSTPADLRLQEQLRGCAYPRCLPRLPRTESRLFQAYSDQVLEVIDLAEKKASEKETKYKNIQKVRRYFFIDNEKIDPNSEGVRYVMKCLQERASKEDKFYSLSENYESFQKKYAFMMVDKAKLEEASKANKQ